MSSVLAEDRAAVSPIIPRIAVIGVDGAFPEGWAGERAVHDLVRLHPSERLVRRVENERFDIIVVELDFQSPDAVALLGRLRRSHPSAEIIVVCDAVPPDAVVAAMRLGASDFVSKSPLDREALASRVEEALARVRSSDVSPRSGVELLVGECSAMQRVRELIVRLAGSSLPVLILGASGTGKELVARALHASSSRAGAPFVAINCAGLSETLIDSELFGHERGAFTGAQTSRQGLFDSADGGTLFLDEIGDMPPQTQVRLLRTLQEGEVRPVGATRPHHVDVRVLSATNVNMARAVSAGHFRQDLFYRLGPIKVELPTLRQRGRDILLLADRHLAISAAQARRRLPRLSQPVIDALLAYGWPGNVRELRSAIDYALSLSRGETIEMEDLPPSISGHSLVAGHVGPDPLDGESTAPAPNYVQERRRLLAEFDRRYFSQLLRYTKGNLSEASRHSSVDRSNLRRVLREIGLDPTDFRPR